MRLHQIAAYLLIGVVIVLLLAAAAGALGYYMATLDSTLP